MTKNPPPNAPCIRFVWANIDAFAQAYREGAVAFVARIKAPLSKEEKAERSRLIKAGTDAKAATSEVYKRRWPQARGLGMLRLRQDQRRVRREEAAAARAAIASQRKDAQDHLVELEAARVVGEVALALLPPPMPARPSVSEPAPERLPIRGIVRHADLPPEELARREMEALASCPNPRRFHKDIFDIRAA